MERVGAAVTCDGRLFERLQQETLSHRRWTDEYVERPETLMRQDVLSAGRSIVRHTSALAPDHVDFWFNNKDDDDRQESRAYRRENRAMPL